MPPFNHRPQIYRDHGESGGNSPLGFRQPQRTPIGTQLEPENNQGQQGQQGQEGNQGQDNNQNNIAPFQNLWQDDDAANGAQNGGSQGGSGGNTGQGGGFEKAQNAIRAHADKVGLTKLVDPNALRTAMEQGDNEAVQKMFGDAMAAVYQQAITDTTRISDDRIAKAVDAAVEKAVSASRGSAAVDLMHQEIPFSKDADLGPIANAALSQLVKKNGGDMHAAVTDLGKYFDHIATKVQQHRPPPQQPGTRSGSGQQMNNEPETDWFEALSETLT